MASFVLSENESLDAVLREYDHVSARTNVAIERINDLGQRERAMLDMPTSFVRRSTEP